MVGVRVSRMMENRGDWALGTGKDESKMMMEERGERGLGDRATARGTGEMRGITTLRRRRERDEGLGKERWRQG